MKVLMKSTLAILVALLFFQGTNPKQLPELNQIIIDYVKTVKGKKVDRGECWDLANQALKKAGAKWDGKYEFGRLLDLKKEEVLPGDIIQFSNVKVEYKTPNSYSSQVFPHHTAIVFEKINKTTFIIIHQNYGVRKVTTTELNIAKITKGKIKIYRPVK